MWWPHKGLRKEGRDSGRRERHQSEKRVATCPKSPMIRGTRCEGGPRGIFFVSGRKGGCATSIWNFELARECVWGQGILLKRAWKEGKAKRGFLLGGAHRSSRETEEEILILTKCLKKWQLQLPVKGNLGRSGWGKIPRGDLGGTENRR